MKKTAAFKIFYIAALFMTLVNIFFFVKDSFFFKMSDLPTGKLIATLDSSNGVGTLSMYRVENSLGSAIRVQYNDSAGKEHTNVFWQTDIDIADMEWVNDENIMVNNIMINVAKGGYYDCRRGMSIMTEGSIEPEAKQ